jgi:hypothetical protein
VFIYTKTFTATATGTQLKTVVCEKCSTEFYYELSRTGRGSASAVYGIGSEGAKVRAADAAGRNLTKRLREEAELVPCPKCKWVNEAAVRQYRKGMYRKWWVGAGVILFLGGITDLILYSCSQELFNKPPSIWLPAVLWTGLVTVGLSAGILVLRVWLRGRVNPNVGRSGEPRVPVGTPPALVKMPAKADGEVTLSPVASDLSNLAGEGKWVNFRAGQLVFEPLCCECLGEATTTYRPPIKVEQVVAVPMCNGCLGKLRWNWWRDNLAVVPFAVLAGWLISILPDRIDKGGRIAIWAFVACFLTLLGVVIVDKLVRPYRLKTADRARGIFRIRFGNPAYNALLIRRIGEREGLFEEQRTR